MNESIYMLPDSEIYRRIGKKIRQLRLRQNITQESLAEQSQISVSSVKKIENGEIGSVNSLTRLLRILGQLEILSPLLKEEEMSPNEYLKFMEDSQKKRRKRAKSNNHRSLDNPTDSEW